MQRNTIVDRYIALAFEENGFLEPDFEYSVAYVQGDHCTLRRAHVALDNDRLLNELWPVNQGMGALIKAARNRRMHEVCRKLVSEFGVTVKVVPVKGINEIIEVDVDLMEIVTKLQARDADELASLKQIAGVGDDQLDSWAEKASEFIASGVKKFADLVGCKIYRVLHSAQLNINFEAEVVKEHCIGDVTVVIQTIVDEQGIFDCGLGEVLEDETLISQMMMLARDQLQCTSLNCTITHHPSGRQSSQTFFGLLVPHGDKSFGGFLWEVFSEAKDELRQELAEDLAA